MPASIDDQTNVHMQVVDKLIAVATAHDSTAVRAAAAEALGRAGGERALSTLLALLSAHDSTEVRVAAARGLGELARGN